MKKLNLQQFAGSYTLTVYNDGNFSATSASPNSSLAKDDLSTLTITASSGYELDEIEVIAGGATIVDDDGTWKVKMGNASASIFVKGKKNNVYKVVENCVYSVNGSGGTLTRNMTLETGKTGAIIGVSSNGTELSISADLINQLVKDGVLVKI